MTFALAYIRKLLGWCDETPALKTSFKRDRVDDEFSSDDDMPALKRLKNMKKTIFPDTVTANEENSKNVRYVPIQLEAGHPRLRHSMGLPSTSTPIDKAEKLTRVRTVPLKVLDVSENGRLTPTRKPRMHTPLKPVVHAVIDDDDDEEEVTLIKTKPEVLKKQPQLYIDLDDDENHNQQDDDVIFVKKVSSPANRARPVEMFVTKNKHDVIDTEEEPVYYKLCRNNRNTSVSSPRTYSKFKGPAGIRKPYKKAPTPVPKWLHSPQTRDRFLSQNGNFRSTPSDIFNFDEKRKYHELIQKVTNNMKTVARSRPAELINLADDAASLRLTQRAQKSALNEIRLVEKGCNALRESDTQREYDPITVASISSSDCEVEIVPSESSTSSSVRIDPVNTLKDSYRDKEVTDADWLTKITSKYKKRIQHSQEQLKDVQREADIICKVNNEQKMAQMEHKFKYVLSIPESLFEEPQPTVELPQLSLEQEKLVNRALGPGPPGQLLVEKFNLRIHRRDLQTLSGLNWLNDEVINFYMNLLMQRSEQKPDLPKVYATNTFFYPKLMQSGQAGLRRWTRKVDIFAHDIMVVPVHLGVHWCLSLIDFREKKVSYLDSMGGRNQACLDALLQYLEDEHRDKKGQPLDNSGWKTECLSRDIPQQMNGSDCGMFACTFAEFTCRNAPYTFTQAHMPYLRRKAAYEILSGKLML